MADSQDNTKVVSILAYFLVGIIWYFADEKVQNDMTKHHAKQALNYMIISFVISMVFSMIFITCTMVPGTLMRLSKGSF